MWQLLLAILILLGFSHAALAQQPTFRDPLLDHFAGKWVIRGTIDGKKTVHDLTVDWVLNHQYLRLQEISREKDAKGQPAYAADVYIGWDQPTGEYVCAFLDVFGDISTESIGHAKPSHNDAIAFIFKDSNDSGLFHTTFSYDRAKDTWQMNMDAEKDGKTTPFARTTLTKL